MKIPAADKEIRVLHIIDLMSVGGAQSMVMEFMRTHSWPTETFVLRRSENEKVSPGEIGFIFNESSTKYGFGGINSIIRLIKDKNYNVIHCHLFRSLVYGIIVKIILGKKIKFLYHEHGQAIGSETGSKVEQALYWIFMKSSQLFVDRYIAISNYVGQAMHRKYGILDSKIDVIHNFVSDKFYEPKPLKHGAINSVGFAGRIVQRKGWREFVKIAKIVNKLSPEINFLIAGTGLEEEMLKNEIRECPFIDYIGFQKDMVSYYRLLDIFVVTAEWEPMGLTHLEAQACGVVVVSYYLSGLIETINEDNSIIVTSRDSTIMANQIVRLCNDSKSYAKLSKLSRNNSELYLLDKYNSILEMAYVSV